ncbi:MAG: hypothetical protein V4651_02435, partial [Bacteroidota bacterium]
NNDVYIAGNHRLQNATDVLYNATYWKNNTLTFLTNYTINDANGYLGGIFVKNGIAYSVGYTQSFITGETTPLYFQNNLPIPLTGFT